MSPSNRKIIKIRPRIAMAMVAFVVIASISLVIISHQQVKKYSIATSETDIPPTNITGDFGGGRGGIGYKTNHFISTSAVLVENKSNYSGWETNGPFIDLNSEPHTYTLSDLGLPYVLSKKANSDTLYVEKDGYHLKFLMQSE